MAAFEDWVEIETGGDRLYQVSNFGRLSSEGKLIKGSKVGGFKTLNIRAGSKCKNLFVHRLVAEYFVDRISDANNYVIHLDHDKSNNHYTNLKWVSKSEVSKHNLNNPYTPQKEVYRKVSLRNKRDRIRIHIANNDNRLNALLSQVNMITTEYNDLRASDKWSHYEVGYFNNYIKRSRSGHKAS